MTVADGERSIWPGEVTRAMEGRVPSSCRVWMFGSALVRRRPKDLDLLITYRPGYEVDALDVKSGILAVARARQWPALDIVILAHSDQIRFPQAHRALQLHGEA